VNGRTINIKVKRFDPAVDPQPIACHYSIPYSPGMSVSDALRLINECSGEALAYLLYCRQGICGSCLVKVNEQLRLACCTPADDDLTIEPAFPNMVIKDLITAKGLLEGRIKSDRRRCNDSKI
jgi:succinate dehydrogenase / fumarate reductase iron-sulfur subunit